MTAPITTQPGESLQRVKRDWTDEFTDQHGRKFEAIYDIGNSRPIGELRPVGFAPPWLPPMRFIRWDRQGGFRFHWDYSTMANELAGDATAYYAQVFEFVTEHMPGVEPPDVGEPVPAKVLRSPLGKPPLSPALPLAAEAGEPWILGIPGAPVNEMLKAIIEQSATANGRQALTLIRERMQAMTGETAVPTIPIEPDATQKPKRTINDVDVGAITAITYNEFVKEARKGGMSMADIALAWKAHRENVALAESA